MAGNINKISEWYPGQVWVKEKEIELFKGREIVNIAVSNTGDRPIQVGSHFHFFEVNRALCFDRAVSYGKRLAIPAGTAVRFEPGQSQEVALVDLAGERICYGLNGLTSGRIDDKKTKADALKKAGRKGFKGAGK